MISSDLVMIGYHDISLVALSVLTAAPGAFASRDHGERISDSCGPARGALSAKGPRWIVKQRAQPQTEMLPSCFRLIPPRKDLRKI